MTTIPSGQKVLSLLAIRQRYHVEEGHPIPTIHHDHEILVSTEVVGLNPIDWKAPQVKLHIVVGKSF